MIIYKFLILQYDMYLKSYTYDYKLVIKILYIYSVYIYIHYTIYTDVVHINIFDPLVAKK